MNGLILPLLLLIAAPAIPAGAILSDHERRGAVIERPHGLAEASANACASICGLREGCMAWSWRPLAGARPGACALLGAVRPATPSPGSVTGLSPALAAQIEAAGNRAPNARERAALEALDAADSRRPTLRARDREPGLAGG